MSALNDFQLGVALGPIHAGVARGKLSDWRNPVATQETESDLLAKAVAGDRVAIQQLLMTHTRAVSRFADSRLPAAARDVIDPDDIVQQTFVEAFRSISRFREQEGASFLSWLTAIAENKIMDSVKGLQRQKRGGQRKRVRRVAATDTHSEADLVNLLSGGGQTPSRSVAGHEAVQAVQNAILALPEEYQQAVQLRLLEGKSLDDTAEIMNRGPRAVQGLVDRAKKKMRAALGRLSMYE
jgi:RNA polymerase sigma-70 factor (ECF subfamily)